MLAAPISCIASPASPAARFSADKMGDPSAFGPTALAVAIGPLSTLPLKSVETDAAGRTHSPTQGAFNLVYPSLACSGSASPRLVLSDVWGGRGTESPETPTLARIRGQRGGRPSQSEDSELMAEFA